jgi:CubicO group peptidase (beta-lactamase class C family)
MTATSLQQLPERPFPMRSTLHAAAAILALIAAAYAPARAQTETAPSAALPHKPLPYTQLQKRPVAHKPHVPAAIAAPAPGEATPATDPVNAAPASTPAAVPAPEPPVAPASPPPADSPGARLSPATPLPPAELEAFVDGMVRGAMAREHIAGVTVAVVQNGQVILKKGYGFASLRHHRPVDPDNSLFRIGSISKTFTWIALMKEVEAGRIHLERPVNLYLPEKVQVRDQGYDTPVRVVDLMDHSAGFEDRTLGQLFERDPDRVRPLELYLRQERPRRVHAPGDLASYSNYGAALAGEAITYTTGRTFERVAEDEIIGPLGLRHTTFREPRPPKAGLPAPMSASLAQDVAEGYRWTASGFVARPYEYIGHAAPAGGASSTAGDMASYMLMLLGAGQSGGVTIYSPRTAEAFRTPLRHTPKGINGWANGFQIYDLPGGFQGYGQEGSTLSFMSNMVTVPALNLGIFVSANTETGRPLVTRLPEQLVREFYARPIVFPRPGSPDLAAQAQVFDGDYMTTRRAYRGLEGFIDQLIGGARVRVTDDGRLLTNDNDGVKIWVPDGPPGAGLFLAATGDERLAFQMADGKAVAYQTAAGDASMERASLWRQPMVLALLAALTATASLATLGGLALRNRREFRENAIQGRASLIQNTQAALWLAALALFSLWVSKSGDLAEVMYRWPGALLVMASACALVAAALTVLTLAAIPAVWSGGRRVDSWHPLRKTYFTVTVLIYSTFAVLLGLWGALSPWSG